jgi:uncharacterized protein
MALIMLLPKLNLMFVYAKMLVNFVYRLVLSVFGKSEPVTEEIELSAVAAAMDGVVKKLEELLEAGVPVDTVDEDGATLLTLACIGGCAVTVKLLLSHGANVNAVDEDGNTPLMRACKHNNIIRLLLASGANVNLAPNGRSALWFASRYEFTDMITLLLDGGADVNLNGDRGTALTIASMCGNAKAVDQLLSAGADVNAFYDFVGINDIIESRTPLMLAIQFHKHTVVDKLLVAGADIEIQDNRGWTAVDYYNNSIIIAPEHPPSKKH